MVVGRLGWVMAAGIPLAVLTVFFVWPIAALIGRGFFPDGIFTLAGIADVMGEPRTVRVVAATLAQAAVGMLVSVAWGLPAAKLLYRTAFPGRGFLRALVTVPFVLPTVVVGVAFKSMVVVGGPLAGLGLDQTFTIVVAALAFFNIAVVIRTVGGLWASLDDRPAQVAATLGTPPARVWWTITLPALGPAIASSAVLVFLFCASAYGVVMVLGGLGYATIETEIWFRTNQLLDLSGAAALSVVQIVVVTASLLVANRLQTRLSRAQRLRTEGRHIPRWRAERDWAVTLVTGLLALFIVVPLAELTARSLTTATGWGFDHYRSLLAGTDTLAVPAAVALGNSLRTAGLATVLAVGLGVLVSLVVSRRPDSALGRRLLDGLDAAFMLPLGVSAVTVGFGFLIALNRPPLDLRTSLVLIPIAQAIVALPLVLRVLLPVLRAIDPKLREAAAVLGASPGRVLATIDLAFLTRGLGLAIGFAFATSLGEFGATSFLARPDQPTLPVLVFRLIGRPGLENQGTAMAAAVVLAGFTVAVMALAERMRPREVTAW
ncbi:MAG: ABC transporter permease [Propioniciclava sp.]